MARQVIWAVSALDDLDEAAEYIARDSEFYAVALVTDAFGAAERLVEMPLMGRMVPELGRRDLRELLVQSYRLVYHVEGDRINILALIHSHRDFLKALPEKPAENL